MNAYAHGHIAGTALFHFDPSRIADRPMTPERQAGLTAEEAARLVAAIANQRDRAAFARLFAFYGPKLKAFMMRSGLAAAVAEDIAQETLLAVWKKAASFDAGRASVSTWIFTIARNLKVDRLRRESRLDTIPDAFDPLAAQDAPASGEDLILTAEREQRVRSALAMLPSAQAEIIRLSFFGESSQTEIAAELGLQLGTVKSRVRLALERLRKILDDLK